MYRLLQWCLNPGGNDLPLHGCRQGHVKIHLLAAALVKAMARISWLPGWVEGHVKNQSAARLRWWRHAKSRSAARLRWRSKSCGLAHLNSLCFGSVLQYSSILNGLFLNTQIGYLTVAFITRLNVWSYTLFSCISGGCWEKYVDCSTQLVKMV